MTGHEFHRDRFLAIRAAAHETRRRDRAQADAIAAEQRRALAPAAVPRRGLLARLRGKVAA